MLAKEHCMRLEFKQCSTCRILVAAIFGFLMMAVPTTTTLGQEATSDIKDKDTLTDEENRKPVDPFAIPDDATVEELFAWINKIRGTPPGKSASDTAKKLFPAIIKACDKVIESTNKEEDVEKALGEKFKAYGILVRYSPEAKTELKALAEKYAADERPAIAQMGVGHILSAKAANAKIATAEDAQKLADEALAFLERFGVNRTTYSTVSSIASALGYTEHTEIAAVLLESFGNLLEKADDESLRKRSAKMIGAARRIRLLGNEIKLSGVTADGDEFDWSAYRGKVVLVDFWASWCGPCIGEIPNMKKNLELYGEKGFEIVGINMDSTRAALEKCVRDKEIAWVNIVSDEEGKRGWDAPIADYYGVSAIPCAILVDKQGIVVSLGARGKELDKQLESLLGSE